MTARLDLRLAPAALGVWAVTLLGLLAGWLPAVVVAVLSAATAVPFWLARQRAGSRAALVLVLLIGVAASAIAVRAHAAERNPLRQAAERGSAVVIQAELTTRPQPLQGASFGAARAQDRALVRAEVLSLQLGAHRVRTGGSVVLLVPTDSWRELVPGQRVTVSGKAVPPRSGELTVAMVPVHRPPSHVDPAPVQQRIAADLRAGLRAVAVGSVGQEAAGLLSGLVVGDTDGLAPEVRQDFETAGLSHLTAVSGANLAIVCGAVLALMRLLGVGPVPTAIGGGLALAGFVLLAGGEPSVLRAAVMGGITLLALALGRQRSALPVLSASVLVLLLVYQELASSLGFALSVVATAGLVLLVPHWSQALRERGVPAGVAEAVAVPVAAHLVTAPLVAAMSGEISLVAVPANLLVDPVIVPATVFGVLATISASMLPWLAGMWCWLAGPELHWVLFVASKASEVPGGAFDWPAGLGGGVLLAVLVVVGLLLLRGRRIRLLATVAVLLLVLIAIPVRTIAPGWPPQGWSLVACDVGQGDGLVLSTGREGEAVVVDTGPDPQRDAKCLRRLGIKRISLVLLTHLHADHVNGLATVMADIPVGAVAIGPLHQPDWAYREVIKNARAHRVPVIGLHSGQRITWPSLVFEVLAPDPGSARTQTEQDANDASLVVRAGTASGRILLTGDVELPAQAKLLTSGRDLRADVLKVPHHGSRYTTPRFLQRVRPRLALISVGAGNDYGHPSPVTVGNLTHAGARVLRTDQEGDIAIVPGPRGPQSRSRGDPLQATD